MMSSSKNLGSKLKMSDIAILGGTFDPFHSGHLHIAEKCLETCGVEKVIVIPAKVSPFKQGRKMADESDRLEMAKIAVSGIDGIEVSDIEIKKEGVSYTYMTLLALRGMMPGKRHYLIVGSDQFFALESWYKGKSILRDFGVIVARRPGFDDEKHSDTLERYTSLYGTDIRVMDNDLIDVSSTEIKESLRSGGDITGKVPQGVRDYIYEHGLYR